MVSVKGSFVPTAPKTRAPLYHTIISRWLQKQFVHSCVWTMIVCYVTSFAIGHSYSLWLLLPWTWTLLRAVILFVTLFPVLLIRKANLHNRSNFVGTLLHRALKIGSVTTLLFYTIIATIITRMYINNCSPEKALSLLITQRSYELPRLNERWVYLHFYAYWLGLVGSARHVLMDIDCLPIPTTKLPIPSRLRLETGPVVIKAMALTTFTSITAPLLYVFLRYPIYTNLLPIAKLFYRLPKSTSLPRWPVSLDIFVRSFYLGALFFCLCLLANFFFDVYLAQGPMKKGRLASEKSVQPDETLLNGLQHHSKQLTQLLAFEELQLIATGYKERRVRIFETGTHEATTWLAIVTACTNPIVTLSNEIVAFLNAGAPKQAQPAPQPAASIPASGATPVKVQNANIFKTGVQKQSPLDRLKSSPAAGNTSLTIPKPAIDLVQSYKHKSQDLSNRVLNLWPTDHAETSKRASARLFSAHRLVQLAISSLTELILQSLIDDTYGRVHNDVLMILETFANQISFLEIYLQRHSSPDYALKEPLGLKRELESSMVRIGDAFSTYLAFGTKPAVVARLRTLDVAGI